MHLACGRGHVQIVRILLDAQSNKDINGENSDISPLCLAALNGHKEVIVELLKRGANPTVKVPFSINELKQFALAEKNVN